MANFHTYTDRVPPTFYYTYNVSRERTAKIRPTEKTRTEIRLMKSLVCDE